jgi:hypothetical protein
MGIIDWLKDVYFGKNEKNQLHKEKLISKKPSGAPHFHTSPNEGIPDGFLSKEQQIEKIKKKTTPKPKKKMVITDDQQHWIKLVDMRVNAMPLDFIERIGDTVDRLGKSHASEYKSNEFRVPEDVREEVALDRVEGLSSIRDYIQSEGSKAQKFHLDASIKGALLYATSLGVNIDKYKI